MGRPFRSIQRPACILQRPLFAAEFPSHSRGLTLCRGNADAATLLFRPARATSLPARLTRETRQEDTSAYPIVALLRHPETGFATHHEIPTHNLARAPQSAYPNQSLLQAHSEFCASTPSSGPASQNRRAAAHSTALALRRALEIRRVQAPSTLLGPLAAQNSS